MSHRSVTGDHYRPGQLVVLGPGPMVGTVTGTDGEHVSVELVVPPGMVRPAEPLDLYPSGPRG